MLRPRHLLAAAVAVIALAAGAWLLVAAGHAPAVPQTATVFPEPRLLPAFELVDQDGKPFTRDSLTGQTSLLFFGFTRCPDICPATLQQLALARRQLAAGAGSGDPLPEIVLISVDPARDDPDTLARYVEYFGSGIRGVTGDPEALHTLTDPLGIHFERVPAPAGSGGEYTVSHSAAVLVVDPEARLEAIFGTPHSVEAFVHDLPLLMAGR